MNRYMTELRRSDEFIAREIGEEMILGPVAKARADLSAVLVLEGVGRHIWELLDTYDSEENLLQAIVSQYDVEPETAAADLRSFLDKLRELGALVESEQEDPSPRAD